MNDELKQKIEADVTNKTAMMDHIGRPYTSLTKLQKRIVHVLCSRKERQGVDVTLSMKELLKTINGHSSFRELGMNELKKTVNVLLSVDLCHLVAYKVGVPEEGTSDDTAHLTRLREVQNKTTLVEVTGHMYEAFQQYCEANRVRYNVEKLVEWVDSETDMYVKTLEKVVETLRENFELGFKSMESLAMSWHQEQWMNEFQRCLETMIEKPELELDVFQVCEDFCSYIERSLVQQRVSHGSNELRGLCEHWDREGQRDVVTGFDHYVIQNLRKYADKKHDLF